MEGLAIARAIHDRYHASRRNPWNEVECGDHYARAMASYGVFLAACGFEYHGPKRHLGFAPRLRPENFRAAFTAAEGWGRISQARQGGLQHQAIAVRWGQVRLKTLGFTVPESIRGQNISVSIGDRPLAATATRDAERLTITLAAGSTAGRRAAVGCGHCVAGVRGLGFRAWGLGLGGLGLGAWGFGLGGGSLHRLSINEARRRPGLHAKPQSREDAKT